MLYDIQPYALQTFLGVHANPQVASLTQLLLQTGRVSVSVGVIVSLDPDLDHLNHCRTRSFLFSPFSSSGGGAGLLSQGFSAKGAIGYDTIR